MDENLLQLLFPRHSYPPLLFQVSRGLTLNEDSQSRLLACHTATYHTSSSHERLLLPSGSCAVAVCGFLNVIARAVCAALDFATEAPKIKGNDFLTHATHVAGSCQGTTQTPAEETNERDSVEATSRRPKETTKSKMPWEDGQCQSKEPTRSRE